MTHQEFSARIKVTRDRLSHLARRSPSSDGPPEDDSGEWGEVLEDILEELRVAEETVARQNDELTAAQLALDEERQRYRDFFKQAPDAYLVTNELGIVREANQ